MKALVFGWLIITIATRSACTERALDYRGDDGMVVITPDWSSFASPSSACYRFYRADDGKKVNYGTDMFASAEPITDTDIHSHHSKMFLFEMTVKIIIRYFHIVCIDIRNAVSAT